MFEVFQIFTAGGVVLWSTSNVKPNNYISSIETLISEVLINDTSMSNLSKKSKSNSSSTQSNITNQDLDDVFKTDTHTIRFSRVNDLGVIFVCAYQSILNLSYAEELVSVVKTAFLNHFRKSLLESVQAGDPFPRNLNFEKFNLFFKEKVNSYEKDEVHKGNQSSKQITNDPSLASNQNSKIPTSVQDEEKQSSDLSLSRVTSSSDSDDNSSAPVSAAAAAAATAGSKKKSRRGGKNKNKAQKAAAAAAAASAAYDPKKKKPVKKMRKWTDDGAAEDIDTDEESNLDYSSKSKSKKSTDGDHDLAAVNVDMDGYGKETKDGDFLVSTLSDDDDDDFDLDESKHTSSSGLADKLPFGFLKNFVGGKTLTQDDLEKTLEATQTHLISKNVAPEVAEKLCETVKTSLLGSKTKNWTSVDATVKDAMADALRRVLTPNTSADLLFEIRKKAKANKQSIKGSSNSAFTPYVISVVGVNGVGKSTNLSKIAFWLLQNKFKVLIAACDTFRSGAVEQLRVHVNRLQELTERNNAGHIDMFEEGYGKDAGAIAQHAVEFGRKGHYDVVLIDTAGRRHNDDRLMSSLEKFGKMAAPDKIVMVGEALVGTDSVQQARNFNNAFGPHRNIDFFLISKCDTVGEMVGSLVNMTYSTNIPVLFVGTGQNYTDIRTLSVEWAVQLLMK